MTNISIIVAIADNNAIGKNNELLWHIPDDLKRFKKITSGHTVVMGKNTFLSLPIKPLPNRRNIVISDNLADSFEGCEMAYSIDEAIQKMDTDKQNFVIGGGMVYKSFLPLANKLYITKVHKCFEADVFFPKIEMGHWQIVEEEKFSQENPEPLNFSYLTIERKD
jgi:dihydrofolate reductase